MKALKHILATLALFATVAVSVQAAPPNLGMTPVVSPSTTRTNGAVGTGTNWVWPSCIFAGASVTNVTAIDVSAGQALALEFNAQCTTAQGVSATNIIVQLGRSVSGGIPTNALGTGVKIEWFGTITNTLPASAAANTTYTSVSQFGPVNGFSTGGAEGALQTIYIGWITAPANTIVTNYSIYAKTK